MNKIQITQQQLKSIIIYAFNKGISYSQESDEKYGNKNDSSKDYAISLEDVENFIFAQLYNSNKGTQNVFSEPREC